MKRLIRFLKDEEAVTATEYALLAVLVAMAIILGVTAVGSWLGATFNRMATEAPPPS